MKMGMISGFTGGSGSKRPPVSPSGGGDAKRRGRGTLLRGVLSAVFTVQAFPGFLRRLFLRIFFAFSPADFTDGIAGGNFYFKDFVVIGAAFGKQGIKRRGFVLFLYTIPVRAVL